MQGVMLNIMPYDCFYRYYCTCVAILEEKLSENVKFSNKQNVDVAGYVY